MEPGFYLTPEQHEAYHADSVARAWVDRLASLYPQASSLDEAYMLLKAEAEEIEARHEPYLWGQGRLDPVAWAEEITRQAAAEPPPMGQAVRSAMSGDNVQVELAAGEPSKRLGALRRAEERSRVGSTRKALAWLLGATKALRRRLRAALAEESAR